MVNIFYLIAPLQASSIMIERAFHNPVYNIISGFVSLRLGNSYTQNTHITIDRNIIHKKHDGKTMHYFCQMACLNLCGELINGTGKIHQIIADATQEHSQLQLYFGASVNMVLLLLHKAAI